MPTFYGAIDLSKNELRNAVIQNLASAPATPSKGQLYMDTTANLLYWWNGTAWVSAAGPVPATTVTTQAIGDGGTVGTSLLYARADHSHGMPSFGTAVVQTAFGMASANGFAATLAR